MHRLLNPKAYSPQLQRTIYMYLCLCVCVTGLPGKNDGILKRHCDFPFNYSFRKRHSKKQRFPPETSCWEKGKAKVWCSLDEEFISRMDFTQHLHTDSQQTLRCHAWLKPGQVCLAMHVSVSLPRPKTSSQALEEEGAEDGRGFQISLSLFSKYAHWMCLLFLAFQY